MKNNYTFLAKTFKGLETVLANELLELGALDVEVQRRAVSFKGDLALLYRANLYLRTASRILMPIVSFRAKTADEIYNKVKEINWDMYMSLSDTFSIDVTSYSDIFRNSQFITYRVKDAVADYFSEKTGKRPNVHLVDPNIYINVHIANDQVTVSLDSSGESLHKRGWRQGKQTEAPINEALAAGLILLTGWRGETDFYDPMCGSATFLIEAAMIALNMPPGLFRSHFAFENWHNFDRTLFEEIYNDDSLEREFEHHIYGSDSSFYVLRVAENNIKNAGVQRYITLHQCAIQDIKPQEKIYTIVMNPPYGERLQSKDILKLYDEIGSTLKHKFAGSVAWIISSNEEALKQIGLRPSQRLKMLNGDLDCLYNKYELFKGERKDFVAKRANNAGDKDKRSRAYSKPDRTPKKNNIKQDRPRKHYGTHTH